MRLGRSLRQRFAVGLVAACMLVFLALQARPFDSDRHTRTNRHLSRLQEEDLRLIDLVFQLRNGLLNNYDSLTATLRLAEQHRAELDDGPDQITRRGHADIDRAMAAFTKAAAEKEELIEWFKTHHALLKNSALYFPQAIDAVTAQPDVSAGLRRQADALLRDILQLGLGATTAEYRQVENHLKRFAAERARQPQAIAQLVDTAVRHAESILEHRRVTGELIVRLGSVPTQQASRELEESYYHVAQRDLNRANAYRAALALVAVLLLMFAVAMFARLQRNGVRLRATLAAQVHEIAERKKAVEELGESEARYRQLVDLSPDAILIAREGRVAFVNGAGLLLFGASQAQQLLGRSFVELMHADCRDRVAARMLQLQHDERPTATLEKRIVRLNGGAIDIEMIAAPFMQENQAACLVVMRDISLRKQAEQQLVALARYDTLTGLPNRHLFMDRLVHAMNAAKRTQRAVALMFLDLDRFKEINDTLGHAAGDRVLEAAARRLSGALRSVDTVARLGGDEFTVILEDVENGEQVAAVATKIKDAFATPLVTDEREIFITPSIGIAMWPSDGDSVQALMQSADVALYHAKDEGRNCHAFYAASMNAQAAESLKLEGLLRRALERQEFVLHYQPKVDIASGRITGVEALVRWQSAELGMVSPGRFIPLAERSGLIVPVGEWVLRTACAQAKAWQEQGLPPLLMSVNVSPRQFREADLADTVQRALTDHRLEPRYLELEITEGMIMQRTERTIALLETLQRLGARLSIDDFGTGYSSLAYLKRFPVQRLKIDQSFVRDVAADADDAAIVIAIIGLAKSLKMDVTAEGVETAEQLAFLTEHGCDEYQGYHFSRPVPAEEFTRLLGRPSLAPTLAPSPQVPALTV
jgi:diguanylate cyclase (GGDEF)-like protein/PAS domain S-box-containing protein